MRFPSALSFFPALVAIIIALPAGATLLILGQSALSRPAWQQLFSWPGLTHSVALSLLSTLVATLIALVLALSLCQRRAFTGRFSTLLLGMPHIALATGLILLLAPSGWLLRLFSPWLSGFEQPPDWPLINDPCAITLTLLLIMKETPFLFLMARNQCEHIDTLRQLQTGSALGYPPTQTWWRIVVPQLLPGLRLPVFCVLAFSLSAADIGILLGPQRPPTLATLIWQWSVDPRQDPGVTAAAALLLLMLTLFGFTLWRGIEALWRSILRQHNGRRSRRVMPSLQPLWHSAGLLTLGAYLALIVASVAMSWRFPDSLPARWTADRWIASFGELASPIINALFIALVSNLVSLLLALGTLEWQRSRQRTIPPAMLLLPLLLPQLNLVFGLQYLTAFTPLSGSMSSVIYAHVLFILPYYFLSLSGTWRSLDPRLLQTALSLGKSPWQALCGVTLPLTRRALAIAFALGVAISLGLYLPTQGLGAGRIPTLATETVAYAAGIDQRMAAVAALWQTAIPLLFYLLALSVPHAIRRRKYASPA